MNSRCAGLLAAAVTFCIPLVGWAENGEFAGDRADTVAEGRIEMGILESSRWGVTRDVELYTHPLFAILVPHVGAKVSWSDSDVWRFSTRHELSYPSFGLGVVSGEGAGGFLPADQEIPQLVVLDTEAIMTMTLPLARRFVTVAVGFEVAPRFSGPPVLLEAPVLFPRSAVYTSGVIGHARFTYSAELPYDLDLEVTARGFFLPEIKGFVAEQEVWLGWGSSSWRIRAGAINSTGWYPYGLQAHRYPLIDALFAF